MKKSYSKQVKGFATLFVIVAVSAVALLMAFTAFLFGVDEMDSGFSENKGREAYSAADGCMEEALFRLHLDSDYSGGVLATGDASCIITIVDLGGNQRQIDSTATVLNWVKTIRCTASIGTNNKISIINLEEL